MTKLTVLFMHEHQDISVLEPHECFVTLAFSGCFDPCVAAMEHVFAAVANAPRIAVWSGPEAELQSCLQQIDQVLGSFVVDLLQEHNSNIAFAIDSMLCHMEDMDHLPNFAGTLNDLVSEDVRNVAFMLRGQHSIVNQVLAMYTLDFTSSMIHNTCSTVSSALHSDECHSPKCGHSPS